MMRRALQSLESSLDIRPLRQWKTSAPDDVAGMIANGATLAVGWLSDPLAAALCSRWETTGNPGNLTVVYATTSDAGRSHGLNILARDGLVRRVVGGQWHPVPRLQALAAADRIEAYSLPVGVINRLFRDIAEGMPGHLTRAGLGTFADPRNGGGRLNRRTREQLVRLVRPAGEDALLYQGFPVDVAIIGVGFMGGSAAITMTRDAMTMARAARQSGGLVIAQPSRVGTLERLPPGEVEVPESLVDVLVSGDLRERVVDGLAPVLPAVSGLRRLAY